MPLSEADMQRRLVRYSDLRPCTTAFVDARTPGSERKENFTIIGPGVAENPDQHVHINIPHGFNVGGARQPPSLCKLAAQPRDRGSLRHSQRPVAL